MRANRLAAAGIVLAFVVAFLMSYGCASSRSCPAPSDLVACADSVSAAPMVDGLLECEAR